MRSIMIFSAAAAVAFTPTLRPSASRQSPRAAVVCGLELPVPPAQVRIIEAAAQQQQHLQQPANIFPTDLLAAKVRDYRDGRMNVSQ